MPGLRPRRTGPSMSGRCVRIRKPPPPPFPLRCGQPGGDACRKGMRPAPGSASWTRVPDGKDPCLRARGEAGRLTAVCTTGPRWVDSAVAAAGRRRNCPPRARKPRGTSLQCANPRRTVGLGRRPSGPPASPQDACRDPAPLSDSCIERLRRPIRLPAPRPARLPASATRGLPALPPPGSPLGGTSARRNDSRPPRTASTSLSRPEIRTSRLARACARAQGDLYVYVGINALRVICMARPRRSVPERRQAPHIPQPGTGIPKVPAELSPLVRTPPSPPPLRRPRSGLCRRRSSLPSAKTRSLRTGRASNPQGPAASSPRQHRRGRFCRHCPRTGSTPKSQIPTRTGSRRRQPSSGGLRPAAPTERPAGLSASSGCRGPAAPECRAVPAPVPRGRGATWSSASVTDSACRRPPSAAGSVNRSGCSLPIGAGSSRSCQEGTPAKLSMDVNPSVGSPSAGVSSSREIAMVRIFIRSSPAVPICNGSTGSLPFPSGPRRLPSGSRRAAWSHPCTHGAVSPASGARGRSPCVAAYLALASSSPGALCRIRPAGCRPERAV